MNNQAFSKIWIAVILLVLITGGILAWQHLGVPKEEAGVPEEIAEDGTADWKTYRNDQYQYQFEYPATWSISHFKTIAATSPDPSFAVFDSNGSKIFMAQSFPGMIKVGPELFEGNNTLPLASGFVMRNDGYHAVILYQVDETLAHEENINGLRVVMAELITDIYLNQGWKDKVPVIRAVIFGETGVNVAIEMAPKDKNIFDRIIRSFKFEIVPKGAQSLPAVPPLYPNTSWSAASSTIKSDAIYYRNYLTGSGFIGKRADLPGQEWNGCANDYKEVQSFKDYYNKELEKRGWIMGDKQLVARGFEINPKAAGGPMGETWGYVRGAGDSVQVIIFSESHPFSGPDEPPQRTPCDYKLSVFVSDEVKIDSFLPK